MIRHFPVCFHRALRLILAVLCLAGISASAWAQFETRATSPLLAGAYSIAAGDFNGDGKLDIAVVDDNGFSVSLGNGDGTFQKPTFYPTGLAYSLAVADFNNDGNLDIVVANENLNPSTVSVYLGNGDGTFRSPIDSNTTNYNEFVAVGDFNGDGKMDIVVVENPYISVLLGNGDGSFQSPSDNDSFVGAQNVAVGDFNNDHKLDVVVVGFFGGSQGIGVLLGNGDGTLQSSVTTPLTYVPATVSVGDFDADGNLDAAVADKFSGVTVLLGDGTGGFGPQTLYGTTSFSGGPLIVSDLNLDGKIDLAIQSATANNQVGGIDVFWGNGDGTFQPAPDFFGSGLTGLPVLGDFNNDHLPDIVLANELSAITVLNSGVASFSSSAPMYFGVRLIGTQSPSQAVKLTNDGSKTLSISSFNVSGPFKANNNCGRQLAPLAACTISANYEPSKAAEQRGGITIVDSASSKPQFIELLGSGTYIVASPTSLNFGSQKVGTKSAAQVVTVTNESGVSVIYYSVTISGAESIDFAETNNCTGVSSPPGGTCQVNVKFTPKEKGARTATLSVKPQGTAAPAPVALDGTGT
jgi:hypothetical protein